MKIQATEMMNDNNSLEMNTSNVCEILTETKQQQQQQSTQQMAIIVKDNMGPLKITQVNIYLCKKQN